MNISAAHFKARCLKIMDQVNNFHEECVITKRGKPVARLVPAGREPVKTLFGCMKGSASFNGDPFAPVGGAWNADG